MADISHLVEDVYTVSLCVLFVKFQRNFMNGSILLYNLIHILAALESLELLKNSFHENASNNS